MPIPSEDLSDLADKLLGGYDGTDLSRAGQASAQIQLITGNEQLTTSLVATFFWQAFTHTRDFINILKSENLEPADVTDSFVVCHNARAKYWYQYDLIVLSKSINDPENYATANAVSTPGQLRVGWETFFKTLGDGARPYRHIVNALNPATAAVEAQAAQPFRIIIFRKPEMLPTASTLANPINVTIPSSSIKSTAGVLAVDGKGRQGVTAAFHTIKANIGDQVIVGSYSGTVVGTDLLSDSAFIELNDLSIGIKSLNINPLANLLPRQFEHVTFEGIATAQGSGLVQGWSPQLPFVSGNSQLVVTTNPITMPGDSGAALFDSSNNLIGFAHERTGFNAPNPFSSWIWAESVFKSHALN